ncbi:WD40/YVTN/BNR-like repeat-containing protein [Tenacibaculum sp. UWU-22]|uniref:WD40/YVTN/BNR-like repeat-containing protein n=1 Tax=Tenacibaculum sp. UWU-22 TaxID=3234187 RepID=UPI0034DAC748
MKHGKNNSYTKRILYFLTLMSVFLLVFVACIDNVVVQQPENGGGSESGTTDSIPSSGSETTTTPTPDYNSSYQWGNLAVGGGGYVTGIVIHPTAPDVKYIRTDVGGAYRWDASKSEWIPMLRNIGDNKGAAGLALDKNNPNRVYAALNGGIYRSNDKGVTWQLLKSVAYNSNASLRWFGEPIAVDPNNSDVIYAGTVNSGVLRSLNGGNTWSAMLGVPTKEIRSVVINPNVQANGRSKKVYVAVTGKGLYRSSNGGDTFALMAGAPEAPNCLAFQDKLYVTHSQGIAKYGDGAWTDLTPNGVKLNYGDIAIEPGNTSHMVTTQFIKKMGQKIYRSSNGGSSWETIDTGAVPVVQHREVPWWPNNWFSAATAAFAFDPQKPGNLYFTDWFGIWNAPNFWANPIDFYTKEKGHEEVVTLTVKCPPSGAKVYSGVADVFGFKHTSVTDYPEKQLYNMHEGFDIAYCESQPNNIAYLGADSNNGAGTTKLLVSADSGDTWTVRSVPGSTLGRVAISSTDANKMVYIAGGATGSVYYSTNKGASWSQASGAPTGSTTRKTSNDVWNKAFLLTADTVDGDTFFLFDQGYLYASFDGGATWAKRNTTAIPTQTKFLNVAAAPGLKNEVWVSLYGEGLYKTSDGGKNFTKVDAFTKAISFSWGKPVDGSTTPTAYCFGDKSGVQGLYLSTDLGATWTRADKGEKYLNKVRMIAADRQTFGRVYLGSSGEGIFTAGL